MEEVTLTLTPLAARRLAWLAEQRDCEPGDIVGGLVSSEHWHTTNPRIRHTFTLTHDQEDDMTSRGYTIGYTTQDEHEKIVAELHEIGMERFRKGMDERMKPLPVD